MSVPDLAEIVGSMGLVDFGLKEAADYEKNQLDQAERVNP